MLRSAPVTRLPRRRPRARFRRGCPRPPLPAPPRRRGGQQPAGDGRPSTGWPTSLAHGRPQVFGSHPPFGTDFFPDYGLTLDAVLTLALSGDHEAAVDRQPWTYLEPELDQLLHRRRLR